MPIRIHIQIDELTYGNKQRWKELTVIESLDSGELVLMLLHEVREVVEQGCTLGARGVETPCRFESVVGGLDCGVDVFPGGFGD